MWKNKHRFLSLTLHKNQLKIDESPKCENWNSEVAEGCWRQKRENTQDIGIGKDFLVNWTHSGCKSSSQWMGPYELNVSYSAKKKKKKQQLLVKWKDILQN